MNDPYLKAWFGRLDGAIKKAKSTATGDAELEGFLASYLVVLASGAYEECVEHLFRNRAGKSGDQEVRSFVHNTLHRSFRNPDFDKIVETLRDFSDSYANQFRNRVDTNAKLAIDSIVNNKNHVSHGKSCTVTLSDVENYYYRSIPIFEVLEDILG